MSMYGIKRYSRKNSEFYLVLFLSSILCYVFKIARWKLILLLEIIVAILYSARGYIKRKIRNCALLTSKIYDIDKMDGIEFENFLVAHFEKQGYRVKTTKKSNDFGADLILKRDGKKTVVQAKRYKGRVGIAAIQQAYSSMGYYKADQCMVITNSYYTASAKKLAKQNKVILWDRDTLVKKFKIAKGKE